MGRLNKKGLIRLIEKMKENIEETVRMNTTSLVEEVYKVSDSLENISDSLENISKNDILPLKNDVDSIKAKTISYDNVVNNFRKISFSTELPSESQGNDGDIWIKYNQD